MSRRRSPWNRRWFRLTVRGLVAGWLVGFAAAVSTGVFAGPVAADNCSTFADCFNQSGAASEAALGLTLLAALSLVADFIGGGAPLRLGRMALGQSGQSNWERSVGMLGLAPSVGAAQLLGLRRDDVVDTWPDPWQSGGLFSSFFASAPGVNPLLATGPVDDWIARQLGSGADEVAGAANHFFGRDVFDQQEWHNFYATMRDGSTEVSSLVPGSIDHLSLALTDPEELNRRYKSYGIGLLEGTQGVVTFAHSIGSMNVANPSFVIELHRWNQTGEHRGVMLTQGSAELAGSLQSLHPASPEFYRELGEMWQTKSIAEHDGAQSSGAIIAGIVDWETFKDDPSQWAGRMTIEGIVEVATGAAPFGAGDNLARAATEGVETAADAQRALPTPKPPDPPSSLDPPSNPQAPPPSRSPNPAPDTTIPSRLDHGHGAPLDSAASADGPGGQVDKPIARDGALPDEPTVLTERADEIYPTRELLDGNDLVAIEDYTSHRFRQINDPLRSGEPVPPEIRERVEAIDTAIEKLPVYRNTVYRTTNLPSETINDMLKNRKFKDLGFFSTSTDLSAARNFNGSVEFTVESHSGRLLGDASGLQFEREVLFHPGTEFSVGHMELIDGKWFVNMSEIGG